MYQNYLFSLKYYLIAWMYPWEELAVKKKKKKEMHDYLQRKHLLLTSVAAFLTISSWPLWIWMLQKKPLKSLRRIHPVILNHKKN